MAEKIYAAITGIQGYVPDYVLTNKELETMVDTSDEWITTRTGISERRIIKDGITSDLGVRAVEGLLKKCNLNPNDIDLLICATVTGDMVMPDTANTILDKIGATNVYGYDIRAACSGFLFSLFAGAMYIESGRFKRVVVVGADKMSSIVDYNDRTTCVLFGDAAGAVLLEPRTDDTGVRDAVLRGDGSGRDYLYIAGGGAQRPTSTTTIANKQHFVYQNGQPVFKAAVKGMVSAMEEVLRRNHLTKEDIQWVVPHQANMRIINSVSEMLGFPKERVMMNIGKYGNTTAATIPLCLWEWSDRLKKGDNLLLTSFGGGFTWGAIYVKWAIDPQ
ncbi:MAG: ketoacyl-ACP synthase III [Saprospiraceae bacterium]|nr:ketoacyl-ACP synthase III [Saprospiraceae bacterium]MBP7679604.1 ketoacyl-ACP synthase III [Saprospiraceae bacterium]